MLQKNGNLFPTQSRLRGKVRVRALMSDAQDQDLQRAFAASMEEQARPQSVGEDDADMMRALAQSVHDQVPSSGGTMRADLLRLRSGAPVALAVSYTHLTLPTKA